MCLDLQAAPSRLPLQLATLPSLCFNQEGGLLTVPLVQPFWARAHPALAVPGGFAQHLQPPALQSRQDPACPVFCSTSVVLRPIRFAVSVSEPCHRFGSDKGKLSQEGGYGLELRLSRTSGALCTALYLGRVPEVSWHIGRGMPSPDPTGCTRHHRASHPPNMGSPWGFFPCRLLREEPGHNPIPGKRDGPNIPPSSFWGATHHKVYLAPALSGPL